MFHSGMYFGDEVVHISQNFPFERSMVGLYGDGSDGDATISGSTTAARDLYYNTLTVASGGELKMNGFKLFVRVKCTVQSGGIISNDAVGYL